MRCSKCATENPAGKKFCGGCGSALSAKCPRGGAENTPSFNFCGDCGASLSALGSPSAGASGFAWSDIRVAAEPSEVPEGERKTVTALFADIKGSMDLMEDLDPEEARAIVDPALKLMMDAVHHYGASWRNPRATESSHFLGPRSLTRIIPNERYTPR